jgi:nucleotide-binding universal stress UspA family protein
MDTDIKHILFTSDLMEGSRYVFKYAMGLADKYRAKLTILHVMQEPSGTFFPRINSTNFVPDTPGKP